MDVRICRQACYSKVKKINVPCAADEVYREWRSMFYLLTLAVDGHKFYSFTSSRFKREEDPAVHFRGSLSVL
jgi:hypothetical protein